MSDYSITFGTQYRPEGSAYGEPHPHWPPADGNGWLVVSAPDQGAARAWAWANLGQRWAFIYDGDTPPHPELFPAGVLARADSAERLPDSTYDPTERNPS
jgi:hypothetical protein